MSPRHGQDPVRPGWVATVTVSLLVGLAVFWFVAVLMGWW
jgi:hypothetical protein